MKSISNFINEKFKDLPDSPNINDIKQEIIDNMQDKVDNLVKEGMLADEALNKVINDFGDFQEIYVAYGLQKEFSKHKFSRRFLLIGNIINSIYVILFVLYRLIEDLDNIKIVRYFFRNIFCNIMNNMWYF